ncbi:hypothetical protein MKEN_00748600 [Mycena kentingensis (nom. inval.)]|nr:hypothetical protein MKEN_00748600 [Mycena kentingensis (nom. inval.)]
MWRSSKVDVKYLTPRGWLRCALDWLRYAARSRQLSAGFMSLCCELPHASRQQLHMPDCAALHRRPPDSVRFLPITADSSYVIGVTPSLHRLVRHIKTLHASTSPSSPTHPLCAMSYDHHIRRGHPITLSLIILFGIIELSLAAWLTSQFNKLHNPESTTERDRVRFTLFVSTWTVVWSALLLVLFVHSATGSVLTSVLAHLVFLGITWLLWTAAAAAVTEMLGGGLNCKTQDVFAYCNQLNALEAFAWIEWLLVTFAIIVVLIRGISAARRGDGYRGGLVSA